MRPYSKTQILLHWAVALLILAQFLFSDGMSRAWRSVENGEAVTVTPLVYVHIAGGVLALLFMLWRLVLRVQRGAPPEVPGLTPMMATVSHVTHWALYAVTVLMVVSGGLAWYGGIQASGEAHQLFKMLLVALIAGHVAAALWHQFVRKDGLLRRMTLRG